VRDNPLVAGFQEDLAPDDDLGTASRTVSDVVLRADPSSDEDGPSTVVSKPKDSSPSVAKSGPVSVAAMYGTSWRTQREPGSDVLNVTEEGSSGDEVVGRGRTVRRDVGGSDEDLDSVRQKNSNISTEQVGSVFLLLIGVRVDPGVVQSCEQSSKIEQTFATLFVSFLAFVHRIVYSQIRFDLLFSMSYQTQFCKNDCVFC